MSENIDIEEELYIRDRSFPDYLSCAGFTEVGIATFGEKIKEMAKALDRPVLIGDMGCGEGKAVRAFKRVSNVKAVGIDKNASPFTDENISILKGDFLQKDSEFWQEKYDLLFCVMPGCDLDFDIKSVISLRRSGLSPQGQGFLVLPRVQPRIDGSEFRFKYDMVKSENIKILRGLDPLTNFETVCLTFSSI